MVPLIEKEERGEAAVEAVHKVFPEADTRIASSKNVPDCIFEIADEISATSIAYRPLADSRLMRVLSEDVSLKLVTGADRPVIILPRETNMGSQ